MLSLFAPLAPYLLAALGLGFVAGWWTHAREPAGRGGIGWPFALLLYGAALLLAIPGALSGRAALALELGLVLVALYAGACVLGGLVHGILRPRPIAEAAGALAGPVAGETVEPPPAPEQPSVAPSAAEPPARPERHVPLTETSQGTPLPGLEAPRAGGPDDLKRLYGVDEAMERRLNAIGVYHIDQITGASASQRRWLFGRIGFAKHLPGWWWRWHYDAERPGRVPLPAEASAPAETSSPAPAGTLRSPALWQARREGDTLVLDGAFADDAARERLLAAARAALAPSTILDRQVPDPAFPADAEPVLTAALRLLPAADPAQVTLAGHDLAFAGVVASDAAADALRSGLAALPEGYRVSGISLSAPERRPELPQPAAPEPPPAASVGMEDHDAEPVSASVPHADAGAADRTGEAQEDPAPAGSKPPVLTGPRGKPDDLKRIRGIGRQNEARLHGLGIWHFDQIAGWSPAEAVWVGGYLAFPGRIEREDWIGQAKALAGGGPAGTSASTGGAAVDALDPKQE